MLPGCKVTAETDPAPEVAASRAERGIAGARAGFTAVPYAGGGRLPWSVSSPAQQRELAMLRASAARALACCLPLAGHACLGRPNL